jgi:hypothetical protein
MTTRTELHKKPNWENDIPTDAKEFYFIPRIFLMRNFGKSYPTEIMDIDMSLTPLYVLQDQEVVMRIVDGQFQIRIRWYDGSLDKT